MVGLLISSFVWRSLVSDCIFSSHKTCWETLVLYLMLNICATLCLCLRSVTVCSEGNADCGGDSWWCSLSTYCLYFKRSFPSPGCEHLKVGQTPAFILSSTSSCRRRRDVLDVLATTCVAEELPCRVLCWI